MKLDKEVFYATFVFGLSVIRSDLTIHIPQQALLEYDAIRDGKVIIFTGSKITGGFCVTTYFLSLRARFPVLAFFMVLSIGIFAVGAGLIFFACFVMGDKEQFQNTILKYEGLWERLTLLCMYIPFIYKAIGNLLF